MLLSWLFSCHVREAEPTRPCDDLAFAVANRAFVCTGDELVAEAAWDSFTSELVCLADADPAWAAGESAAGLWDCAIFVAGMDCAAFEALSGDWSRLAEEHEACARVAAFGACDPSLDRDGDGVSACDDCNDTDGTVGAAPDWILDLDGDGFGTEVLSDTCSPPDDRWRVGDASGDCDDADPGRYPRATEVCKDDIDQDCSGADHTACVRFVWTEDGDLDIDPVARTASGTLTWRVTDNGVEVCREVLEAVDWATGGPGGPEPAFIADCATPSAACAFAIPIYATSRDGVDDCAAFALRGPHTTGVGWAPAGVVPYGVEWVLQAWKPLAVLEFDGDASMTWEGAFVMELDR